ncbi:MAG: acyl-CoA dehydrogenase [Bacteriovoracaceae bacterium]|jgi:acyl-CoA dehydrogenase|nr:acyl-CoA dehydrogenase [Bacteriovoracaceae bacterium]
MELLNPNSYIKSSPNLETHEMMKKVILWFEEKGLKSIKKDFHEKNWNYDFVEFMKKEGILSTLMTPQGYGDENSSWNSSRNTEFAEVSSFYGITYWYTFQVSMLGLGPIFNGENEDVKNKAASLLRDGEVFAFGLSEKEHGADVYSSSMRLIPQDDGSYLARGEKYYIGNGNEAALVSTFGKIEGSDDYVFFVVDSKHPKYECVQNVVNEQNYVAEYRLNDYPITEKDILRKGKGAWDDMLNTINMCKFNLGFGAIGLATHAFYEAMDHAANRNLFGKYVTNFSHVKRFFTDAYCRLFSMKLFATRATDYMRSASLEDRRYLLYNPMVKMKVTMQGEEVVRLLWEVIAAKGFEKEPFFEIAAHEIGMLPKLEGTAHVNMAIIIKFLKNYFFNPGEYPEVPKRNDNTNDTFLFNQGPTGGLGKVQFHDYNIAYNSVDLENVNVFKEQIKTFKTMLVKCGPDENQIKDIDYLLALGEILTLVAYGQLLLENKKIENVEDDLMEEIFDFMIRDFSTYALTLYSKTSNTDAQKEMALKMIKSPIHNQERFDKIWNDKVYAMKGQYK